MGDWHPIPTTPGLASSLVGTDLHVGRAVGSVEVVRAMVRRTDFGATGSVVAQIRNAAGDNVQVALGDNVQSADATGSVSFADGDPILLRVVSADASSMNVGGAFELRQTSGATTYLTTLARVKRWLSESTTAKDAILNDLIPFISDAIETEIGRRIVQQTITAEIHDVPLANHEVDLVPQHWPVTAVSAVREGGATVAASGYRVVGQAVVQRVSGSPPAKCWWAQGFVEIDYTAGYAAIPESLAGAATVEVAMAFQQTREGEDRLGKSGGVFTGQFDAQFPAWDFQPITRRVMAKYQRRA